MALQRDTLQKAACLVLNSYIIDPTPAFLYCHCWLPAAFAMLILYYLSLDGFAATSAVTSTATSLAPPLLALPLPKDGDDEGEGERMFS